MNLEFGKLFSICLIFFVFAVSAFAQENKLSVITETKKISGEQLKSLAKPTDKKPILINFWATWCGPCKSEFPELVEIDRDFRAKGLNFYIVSVDDFAVIDTRVPEFLESYDSTMPSYLINLDSRKKIAKAVRQIFPRFTNAYPLTLLFDAKGKLVFQKAGRINAKVLRAQIEKVLPRTTNINVDLSSSEKIMSFDFE